MQHTVLVLQHKEWPVYGSFFVTSLLEVFIEVSEVYVNTYSRTQLYLFLNVQEFTTTTCFVPICGPPSGCGWT